MALSPNQFQASGVRGKQDFYADCIENNSRNYGVYFEVTGAKGDKVSMTLTQDDAISLMEYLSRVTSD